jgi:hypothetical protein
VYLRRGDSQWAFRTTDVSDIRYTVNAHGGFVEVNCTSLLRNQKLHLRIQSKTPISGFSPRIYIPTQNGFSNTPGCVETYTACASATLFETVPGSSSNLFVRKFSEVFELSALEFGGDFQTAFFSKL